MSAEILEKIVERYDEELEKHEILLNQLKETEKDLRTHIDCNDSILQEYINNNRHRLTYLDTDKICDVFVKRYPQYALYKEIVKNVLNIKKNYYTFKKCEPIPYTLFSEYLKLDDFEKDYLKYLLEMREVFKKFLNKSQLNKSFFDKLNKYSYIKNKILNKTIKDLKK